MAKTHTIREMIELHSLGADDHGEELSIAQFEADIAKLLSHARLTVVNLRERGVSNDICQERLERIERVEAQMRRRV